MPARLRHFAICVSDIEAAAKFYQEVFGLERVGQETLSIGSGIYLSDGVVNLALLSGTVGTAADKPAGANHFGFIVDDVEATQRAIEAHGGRFFFSLGDLSKKNAELKFKDPEGVVFDISKHGWLGNHEN